MCRQLESCTDQTLALRLTPTGDIPYLSRVRAERTLRVEFMQEAWGRAPGIVTGIIVAR
jgi:hypothetical protein